MPARRHHPTLAPSSFPALAKCPQFKGSETVGEAAIRGTRIGATVEWLITGEAQAEAYGTEETTAELSYEIGWILGSIHQIFDSEFGLEVEREVSILDRNFEEVTFGTADYYHNGHLADLKTGERRDYTGQMAALSLGFMDRDGLDSMKVSILWSKTQEVQTWEWDRHTVEEIVWATIAEVLSNAPARPCDYCSWCRHKEVCPARIEAANSLPVNFKPATLPAHLDASTAKQRGELLEKIKIARRWCEDAEAAIESWFLAAPEARPIAGYRLGMTSPRRVWKDELEAAKALQVKAVELGKDPYSLAQPKIVSLQRINDLLGRGKDLKDFIDSLMYAPDGKLALVEDKNSKPKRIKEAHA